MKRKREINKILLGLVGILLWSLTFHSTGMAMSMNESHDDMSTELKIASGSLTIIYFPVKAAYAGLGGIVGGIAYVLGGGDEESAQAVWIPTINGTYQITPDHLRGEKPVQFFGQVDS